MSLFNNDPGGGNNFFPFDKSGLTPRSPTSSATKRVRDDLSPTNLSPVGKPSNSSMVDETSIVSAELRNSLERDCDYAEYVREASECLAKINDIVNDSSSRLNNTNKSNIMDMTQRVTAIVSLLAIQSCSTETRLAKMERDLALTKTVATTESSGKQSYADTLKLRLPKQVKPVQTRPPLPCIVAYPTEERSKEITSSSATKQALMTAIKPSDGFQIVGVKKTAKSGVVLRVTNDTQIKKLQKVDAIKNVGLRLEKPKGRKPRILVKDVPASLEDEKFLTALYNQNVKDEMRISPNEFLRDTKIVRRRSVNGGFKWVGVELSPEIRKHLVSTKDKLFIDWATCRFVDDVEVVRCLKCQQYGHVVKYCTEVKVTCAHCAEEHDTRECPKRSLQDFVPVCASCKRFRKPNDHVTGSSSCPTYTAKLEYLILNTTYG